MKHTFPFLLLIILSLGVSGCTSTSAVKSAATQEAKKQAAEEAQKPAKIGRQIRSVSKKGTHIRVLVNNTPVTNYDVNRRAAFLKLRRIGGNRVKKAEEEMIEQALKIQEATRRRTLASQKQVDEAFAGFAKRNRASPSKMARELNKMGVGADHFKGFIRTQMSWQRTVTGKFRADTGRVSQQKVIFDLKQSGSDKPETTEYILKQIVFVVPEARRKAILSSRRKQANSFRQRFTSCEGAIKLAKELRDVSVIDRGRVLEPELPPEWKTSVIATSAGKTTKPLVTKRGVELMAVCAKRSISDDHTAQIVNRSKEFADFGKKGSKVADDYLAQLRKRATIVYR
ncbi:MAG: molecular chaperone SurA [Hyphomicrobiales bacterium]|nr:MAG: molecular chaperone SurA [Hyphomicrobiales bacterium]